MIKMIRLNGQNETLAAETLAAVLAHLGLATDAKGIAIARNGAVVPRARWAETRIAGGDEIEIIKAMAGG